MQQGTTNKNGIQVLKVQLGSNLQRNAFGFINYSPGEPVEQQSIFSIEKKLSLSIFNEPFESQSAHFNPIVLHKNAAIFEELF